MKNDQADEAELELICQTIQTALATNMGIIVNLIVLIKCRSIPKTTSGKLQRSLAKKMYFEKKLKILFERELYDEEEEDDEDDEDEEEEE